MLGKFFLATIVMHLTEKVDTSQGIVNVRRSSPVIHVHYPVTDADNRCCQHRVSTYRLGEVAMVVFCHFVCCSRNLHAALFWLVNGRHLFARRVASFAVPMRCFPL